jgi:large subunit ribosomal protein L25
MKKVKFEGQERAALGKKETKKLRGEQRIPCVLYGNGTSGVHFTLTVAEINSIVYTPDAYLVDLSIGDKDYTTVLRALQFHPVSDKVLHADFFNVDESKPVTVELPLVAEGNSEGVKLGGKLQILLRKLKVSALVRDLPERLAVDITNLGLGKTVFVRDLSYPGITIATSASSGVCRVKATRVSREATPGK